MNKSIERLKAVEGELQLLTQHLEDLRALAQPIKVGLDGQADCPECGATMTVMRKTVTLATYPWRRGVARGDFKYSETLSTYCYMPCCMLPVAPIA